MLSVMTATIDTPYGRFTERSGRRVNLTQDYESCALKSFRKAAEIIGATLIVDVGANVGVYSVFSSSVASVRTIHAFEPEDEAFAALSENLSIQAASVKFLAHKVALSKENGKGAFRVIAPMHGKNSVTMENGNTTIQLRTLDDTVCSSGEIACVKIDVEGHESEVLSGASLFLQNNPSYLQVECLGSSSDMQRALDDLSYEHLITLNRDFIFLHQSLSNFRETVLADLHRNLGADLEELTALRIDARTRRRQRRATLATQ